MPASPVALARRRKPRAEAAHAANPPSKERGHLGQVRWTWPRGQRRRGCLIARRVLRRLQGRGAIRHGNSGARSTRRARCKTSSRFSRDARRFSRISTLSRCVSPNERSRRAADALGALPRRWRALGREFTSRAVARRSEEPLAVTRSSSQRRGRGADVLNNSLIAVASPACRRDADVGKLARWVHPRAGPSPLATFHLRAAARTLSPGASRSSWRA